MGKKFDIIMMCKEHLPYTQLAVTRLIDCTQNDFRLILVDDSKKPTVDKIHQDHIEIVSVREVPAAKGIAQVCNRGLRKVETNYCVIMANDAIVTPNWDVSLTEILEENSNVGLVHPSTSDIPAFQSSIRQHQLYKELEVHYKEEQGPDKIFELINSAYDGSLDLYASEYVQSNKNVPFRGGWGTALYYLRTSVVRELGGFDENYKVRAFEEFDFFRRMAMVGFKVVISPRSYIHHCGMITRPFLLGASEAEKMNGIYYDKKFGNCNLNPRENWLGKVMRNK